MTLFLSIHKQEMAARKLRRSQRVAVQAKPDTSKYPGWYLRDVVRKQHKNHLGELRR